MNYGSYALADGCLQDLVYQNELIEGCDIDEVFQEETLYRCSSIILPQMDDETPYFSLGEEPTLTQTPELRRKKKKKSDMQLARVQAGDEVGDVGDDDLVKKNENDEFCTRQEVTILT